MKFRYYLYTLLMVGALVTCGRDRYLTGPAGKDGIDGKQGAVGKTGLQGEAGSTGEQGSTGPKGDQGVYGAKGEAGERGERGETGPQGSQGAQGDKGEPGLDGLDGTDGVSASFEVVDLCAQPGQTTTYPSQFFEVALCIHGTLYGVYSANGQAALTELPPGVYTSTAPTVCQFEILSECRVIRR